MINWFKGLSPAMQITVVIATLIMVFIVSRAAKSFISRMGDKADTMGESVSLINQGVKPSFSTSEYNNFANQLEKAMKGPGTKEAPIFSIFQKMENDLDIINLNKAFGFRDTFWGSYDLSEWLRGDLSHSEMTKLNTILAEKGITKQF